MEHPFIRGFSDELTKQAAQPYREMIGKAVKRHRLAREASRASTELAAAGKPSSMIRASATESVRAARGHGHGVSHEVNERLYRNLVSRAKELKAPMEGKVF